MNLLREYIRELLMEDPVGFVHDLAAASEEFGEEGEMFFGGDPGKGGGKAIKRAFSANADYGFLNSLGLVHWTDSYAIFQLKGQNKDELSATMSLPGESFRRGGSYDAGLWIEGRVTLAANNQDELYTGHYLDYIPGLTSDVSEEEYEQRKKSSGINKRPTVSKDYSRYGQLKRGDEFGERMARENIPYVLDQATWNPTDVNEALVDNWKALGVVVAGDLASHIEEIDGPDQTIGKAKQIFAVAEHFGLPIFDIDRNELWSPE